MMWCCPHYISHICASPVSVWNPPNDSIWVVGSCRLVVGSCRRDVIFSIRWPRIGAREQYEADSYAQRCDTRSHYFPRTHQSKEIIARSFTEPAKVQNAFSNAKLFSCSVSPLSYFLILLCDIGLRCSTRILFTQRTYFILFFRNLLKLRVLETIFGEFSQPAKRNRQLRRMTSKRTKLACALLCRMECTDSCEDKVHPIILATKKQSALCFVS